MDGIRIECEDLSVTHRQLLRRQGSLLSGEDVLKLLVPGPLRPYLPTRAVAARLFQRKCCLFDFISQPECSWTPPMRNCPGPTPCSQNSRPFCRRTWTSIPRHCFSDAIPGTGAASRGMIVPGLSSVPHTDLLSKGATGLLPLRYAMLARK